MGARVEAFGDRVWRLAGGAGGARRHRVGPLLHCLSPRSVPESLREEFRRAFLETSARNMLYLRRTRESLSLLSGSIDVLPLKGVLFASEFYPELGARPQSDVDLLVREADLETAHELLIRNGWREAVPRGYYRGHYHWVYEDEGSQCLLELHWGLKLPGTCAPRVEELWRRARPSREEGMEFLRLSSEDLLEYVAVNKAQQHFPALLDFLDLHFIVERGGLDWDAVLRNSVSNRTAGAVWFGLVHCKELLGTSVQDNVLDSLKRRSCAWGGRLLKRALKFHGGALGVPAGCLEGPLGRLYEALLEGRAAAIFNLFFPLVFPPREKLDFLAGGSYWKYALGNVSKMWRSAKLGQSSDNCPSS